MAMKGTPFSSSISYTITMLGCCKPPAALRLAIECLTKVFALRSRQCNSLHATRRPISGSLRLKHHAHSAASELAKNLVFANLFVMFSLMSYCQRVGVVMRSSNLSGPTSHFVLLPPGLARFGFITTA
jgi:hypothetical protein